MTAISAAETDRLLGSWAINGIEPNEIFAEGGEIVGNRGLWLWDNDPIAHAITETLVEGAVGPCGLTPRSRFGVDEKEAATPEEELQRTKINRALQRATIGTRFDASGILSRTEMSKVILRHAINAGDGWAARVWLPNRPGLQYQATCWRLIHGARISNPRWQANNALLNNGVALDESGTALGAWMQKTHPSARSAKPDWVFVPFFDSAGRRQLVKLSSSGHPDQHRTLGWFGQVIPLLRFLGRTMEAKVIADLMKASIGFVIECDEPEAMARADRNGAVLTRTTKIKPGMKYYVKKGTNWKTLDFQFNGADFESWGDFLLKLICANFRIPFEFVLQQLTQTNLAASRVALIQAYKTFTGIQEWLITHVEDPWNQSVIDEDVARGRLIMPTGADVDTDRHRSLSYLRPAQPFPDPGKEASAWVTKVDSLGFAPSTAVAALGGDFDAEIPASKTDRSKAAANGVPIGSPQPAAPAAGAGDPVDPTDGEGDSEDTPPAREKKSAATPTPKPEPAAA